MFELEAYRGRGHVLRLIVVAAIAFAAAGWGMGLFDNIVFRFGGANEMIPLPNHLADCVVVDTDRSDKFTLVATVKCPCGGEIFHLLFPGQTHEHRGQPIPCTAQIAENFFFLIKAACVDCGAEHLLFDKDFHGWDGYVCHDPQTAALPRPELVRWKCLSCGGTRHTAEVGVQSEGKEDFIEECGEEFPAERWVDGFGWFSMSIVCKDCGAETEEWVSYETM